MAKKRTYKHSQAHYVQSYGYSRSTVQRYMKAGHPLDDPDAMAQVEASQKNKPIGKAPKLEIDAAALTDAQLENPRNEGEAKLYERILICRKLAHGIREAKRLVIPLDEVRAGEMRVCAAVKSSLLALPGEMPALLVGKLEHEIQPALFAWVHETLTMLSDARSTLYP